MKLARNTDGASIRTSARTVFFGLYNLHSPDILAMDLHASAEGVSMGAGLTYPCPSLFPYLFLLCLLFRFDIQYTQQLEVE